MAVVSIKGELTQRLRVLPHFPSFNADPVHQIAPRQFTFQLSQKLLNLQGAEDPYERSKFCAHLSSLIPQ